MSSLSSYQPRRFNLRITNPDPVVDSPDLRKAVHFINESPLEDEPNTPPRGYSAQVSTPPDDFFRRWESRHGDWFSSDQEQRGIGGNVLLNQGPASPSVYQNFAIRQTQGLENNPLLGSSGIVQNGPSSTGFARGDSPVIPEASVRITNERKPEPKQYDNEPKGLDYKDVRRQHDDQSLEPPDPQPPRSSMDKLRAGLTRVTSRTRKKIDPRKFDDKPLPALPPPEEDSADEDRRERLRATQTTPIPSLPPLLGSFDFEEKRREDLVTQPRPQPPPQPPRTIHSPQARLFQSSLLTTPGRPPSPPSPVQYPYSILERPRYGTPTPDMSHSLLNPSLTPSPNPSPSHSHSRNPSPITPINTTSNLLFDRPTETWNVNSLLPPDPSSPRRVSEDNRLNRSTPLIADLDFGRRASEDTRPTKDYFGNEPEKLDLLHSRYLTPDRPRGGLLPSPLSLDPGGGSNGGPPHGIPASPPSFFTSTSPPHLDLSFSSNVVDRTTNGATSYLTANSNTLPNGNGGYDNVRRTNVTPSPLSSEHHPDFQTHNQQQHHLLPRPSSPNLRTSTETTNNNNPLPPLPSPNPSRGSTPNPENHIRGRQGEKSHRRRLPRLGSLGWEARNRNRRIQESDQEDGGGSESEDERGDRRGKGGRGIWGRVRRCVGLGGHGGGDMRDRERELERERREDGDEIGRDGGGKKWRWGKGRRKKGYIDD